MSHGRPSDFRCVQFLLAAVAIQGITPDPQDLASLRVLQVVRQYRTALIPRPTKRSGRAMYAIRFSLQRASSNRSTRTDLGVGLPGRHQPIPFPTEFSQLLPSGQLPSRCSVGTRSLPIARPLDLLKCTARGLFPTPNVAQPSRQCLDQGELVRVAIVVCHRSSMRECKPDFGPR